MHHFLRGHCGRIVPPIYLATDLKKTAQHLDEDEFVNVEICTLEELERMIYDGTLEDAKTIASILAYKNKYVK